MNTLINTVNINFSEATVNGMPLPQDDADYYIRFNLIEKDFLELEDIKNLQQSYLSNALWQDGELEKARSLQPQIDERQHLLECKADELLYYVEAYWEDFAKGCEEEDEDDWEDYWEDSIEEDDSCLPSDSYRESFGDFEIVITPIGFEEVEVVFDSPYSMGETGNHYSVQELRALGEKILSMCRFVQKDMGRLVTFIAHPTSVGRERIYKMILLRAGAKITNGRQFVGKREKKHERGESFSFVL